MMKRSKNTPPVLSNNVWKTRIDLAKTFIKEEPPPFPKEQRVKSTPTRQAVLTKRHQSRVKREQQAVHVRKGIQRNSILRRAQRAAGRGDLSVRLHNLPPRTTTPRVVGIRSIVKAMPNGQAFVRG